MWVSKLVLDSRLREVRRAIANPYVLHQVLAWAVRDGLERKEERLLWRLELTRSMDQPVVLVQTWSRPDWNEVLGRWPHFADIHGPKPFNPVLSPGQRLRFRLRANPAKRHAANGKRVALKTPVEKVRWLVDRLRAGGFWLPERDGQRPVRIVQDVFLRAFKQGHTIRMQAVLFEGVVEVVDPVQARRTLERGLGPGKAVGLGLLSVAPGG